MNLETAFDQFLERQFPHAKSQRVLLAVSGGPDSMALLHLFAGISKTIAVAHCNFGLRGAESDADEKHVQQICSELGITCYTTRFETAEYATEHALSIQLAARQLRYEWFNRLLQDHHFDVIATAHHQDDNVETVLINMLRGTGMKGISGIPVQNGAVIRPLLFATKNEIFEYLDNHHHVYRTDVSNTENKYTRNKIRNIILPQLTELNPMASTHIHELSKHAQFAYSLIKEKTAALTAQYVTANNGSTILQYDTISMDPYAPFYLFEIIAAYGFNTTQCNGIHENFVTAKSGSRFLSDFFELIIDRQSLIITALEQTNKPDPEIVINKLPAQTISLNGHNYILELIDASAITAYQTNHLYLNADNLTFPLTCRTWKQGDAFLPLGGFGSKKISDFLIDNKVSLSKKRSTYILETATDGIIAILDHRIDNRFKISPQTSLVLHIHKKEKETM